MSDFKAFKEIKQYKKAMFIEITEKIHGSNAQIHITKDENGLLSAKAGSRTKYLTPGKLTDNYGFAAWVSANASEIIEKLGEGLHYGEWYGAGINSGYNLKERRLALFNTKLFPPERPLPANVDVVPVLYKGPYSENAIAGILDDLKTNGSKLVPGFMNPEGIVINFPAFGHSVKRVFKEEETSWRPAKNKGVNKLSLLVDKELVAKRLQPLRLAKLLSRDSTYREQYPESLPTMARDYIADLEKEDQLLNLDEPTIKAIKKAVWPWIKEMLE